MSYVTKRLKSLIFVLDVIQFVLVNTVLSMYYFVKMIFPLKKKDIRGKLALITGGGNGLGQSIAFALAAKGCNIIILDVDINGAEKTAAEIRKIHNVKAFAFKVDVSTFYEVQNIRVLIEKEIGEIDILVNNAAVLSEISLLEGTPNDIEKIIRKLFNKTIREFITAMHRKKSGHIIAISSLSGYDALGRQLAYSSTKYALRGLMEALQEELRIDNSNIIATTVFPGFIRTREDLVDYMDNSLKNPSSLVYLSPHQVAAAVINAIIYNKLNVTVPSYYFVLLNLLKLLPKEVQNRCRDKFKPILHKNCGIQLS